MTRKPSVMDEGFYRVEVVEAFNVAISCLEAHEPADGDPTGIAYKLRMDVKAILEKKLDRWLDNRMGRQQPQPDQPR